MTDSSSAGRNRFSKSIMVAALVGGVVAIGFVSWIWASGQPAMALEHRSGAGRDAELIARGRYVAAASDCAACHTAPGGRPFAGGLALATPFGRIVASNITPDVRSGIGGWSEAAFSRAVRRGISRDGHDLYPAMPYTAYTQLSDEDIHALKVYLDSLPAVQQKNPPSDLKFPFNIRPFLRVWNKLFFTDGRFEPDSTRSSEWNRGAYLVRGAGHCAVCHSGKNVLGGDSNELEGGFLQGWYAPELSGNRRLGLGKWPRQHIVDYLKTGRTYESIANGPMAEVVEKSTSKMSESDLNSIATYILDLPGTSGSVADRAAEAGDISGPGRDIFERNCSACHSSTGRGVHAMVPRLADSSSVRAANPASLIQTVLYGGANGTHMPAFNDRLNDKQISEVISYIRVGFGNGSSAVSESDIRKLRK